MLDLLGLELVAIEKAGKRKGPTRPVVTKRRGSSSSSSRGGGKKPFRPSHTFWNYTDPKTQSFWVRDMGPERLREMKGKCLLCNTDSHLLPTCPRREEAFANKQFYAYNRPKPSK